MKIIRTNEDLQIFNKNRSNAQKLAFVPTMGYLHDGHISLMRLALEGGFLVLPSIYVNPLQFGEGEDYLQYPRNEERDIALISQLGIDHVFIPDHDYILPSGFRTTIDVVGFGEELCGKFRPGHFKGVCTIIYRFLSLIRPHILVLGQKDFQQHFIIKRMIEDLLLDVEMMVGPIIRENDGLALSSRNTYLSSTQRAVALELSKSLHEFNKEFQNNYKHNNKEIFSVVQKTKEKLQNIEGLKLQYFEVRNKNTLKPARPCDWGQLIALVAAKVGAVRLIDNILLTEVS